ncbi:MAG: hypothetical protein IH991_13975, partial [Planctomycetes bacterium]|nr:hypothetical protein [Planctomycetota bacterium]
MADSSPKIKDNPSHAELVETSKGMAALARVVGFLERFGIKNNALSEAMGRVAAIVEQTNKLVNLPDRFNAHFATRGWIAYESLNVDVMQNAVDVADDGRIDAAEEQLAAHYTAENMRFMLLRLYNIEQFQVRRELTEKVLDDYSSERYHAAVPVLLTIIDGFVNDIEQTGFFAACTDLTAWDSIAAIVLLASRMSAAQDA